MTHRPLICRQCGAALRDADIDERHHEAVCGFCGSITPYSTEIESPITPVASRPAQAGRANSGSKVPRPSSIHYAESFDGIRLVRRWFTPVLFFLLFFCIAWDGFLVFWYAMAMGALAGGGAFGWLFILFPICHVAVGVGLTYFVIAGFLNRTCVDISRDTIRVRHGPVPWRGNKDIDIGTIDQVYFSMNFAPQNTRRGGRETGFCVFALRKDGGSEKLVGMLSSADEARYIVRVIEDFLGWEHQPVAGEMH